MLKAKLWPMKCVSIEGVKGSWKIGMNDVVELGDETYVRIAPYNGGLVALVDLEGKRKTLQGTRGLVKLARLRNEAQVKDLHQEIEAEQLVDEKLDDGRPVEAEGGEKGERLRKIDQDGGRGDRSLACRRIAHAHPCKEDEGDERHEGEADQKEGVANLAACALDAGVWIGQAEPGVAAKGRAAVWRDAQAKSPRHA